VSQRQGKTALTHAAGQESASAVVASQGVSSLDSATALEWMRTRLPEAAQLVSNSSPAAQPISTNREEPLGGLEQDASADQTEEEATKAVQAAAAVEQLLADPEQFAEDVALLETESPVQLQGFELAQEEPQEFAHEDSLTAELRAVDLGDATELLWAPHADADEQAQDPPESEDSTIDSRVAPADAAAHEDSLTAELRAVDLEDATELLWAPHADADEQAQDPPESEDSTIDSRVAPADAAAVEGVAEGLVQSEEDGMRSVRADSAGAAAAEEPQLLAEAPAKAAEESPAAEMLLSATAPAPEEPQLLAGEAAEEASPAEMLLSAVAPAPEVPQLLAEEAAEAAEGALAAETLLKSQEDNAQEAAEAVSTESATPSSNAYMTRTDESPADMELPQQAEMAALQEEVHFCKLKAA
jgi:hypothetical protein